MKTCKVCGGTGPFGNRRSSSDGLMPICKPCINEIQRQRSKTPKRLAAQAWESIKKRVDNANGKNASYTGVLLEIGRTEFMEWAEVAFDQWMQANPGETPSVNRIDPAKHYEAGNLEIMEWGENSRLRRANKNVHAPSGMSWCGKCKAYLPAEKFSRYSSSVTNCNGCCKKCHAENIRTYWVCNACGHKFARILGGPPKMCHLCGRRTDLRPATEEEKANADVFVRRTCKKTVLKSVGSPRQEHDQN